IFMTTSHSLSARNSFPTRRSSDLTTLIDSTFLVSSSELLIENSIRNFEKTQPDQEFQKLYNTSQKNAIATLFIDHSKSDIHFDGVLSNKLLSSFKKFAQWSAVDISVDQ